MRRQHPYIVFWCGLLVAMSVVGAAIDVSTGLIRLPSQLPSPSMQRHVDRRSAAAALASYNQMATSSSSAITCSPSDVITSHTVIQVSSCKANGFLLPFFVADTTAAGLRNVTVILTNVTLYNASALFQYSGTATAQNVRILVRDCQLSFTCHDGAPIVSLWSDSTTDFTMELSSSTVIIRGARSVVYFASATSVFAFSLILNHSTVTSTLLPTSAPTTGATTFLGLYANGTSSKSIEGLQISIVNSNVSFSRGDGPMFSADDYFFFYLDLRRAMVSNMSILVQSSCMTIRTSCTAGFAVTLPGVDFAQSLFVVRDTHFTFDVTDRLNASGLSTNDHRGFYVFRPYFYDSVLTNFTMIVKDVIVDGAVTSGFDDATVNTQMVGSIFACIFSPKDVTDATIHFENLKLLIVAERGYCMPSFVFPTPLAVSFGLLYTAYDAHFSNVNMSVLNSTIDARISFETTVVPLVEIVSLVGLPPASHGMTIVIQNSTAMGSLQTSTVPKVSTVAVVATASGYDMAARTPTIQLTATTLSLTLMNTVSVTNGSFASCTTVLLGGVYTSCQFQLNGTNTLTNRDRSSVAAPIVSQLCWCDFVAAPVFRNSRVYVNGVSTCNTLTALTVFFNSSVALSLSLGSSLVATNSMFATQTIVASVVSSIGGGGVSLLNMDADSTVSLGNVSFPSAATLFDEPSGRACALLGGCRIRLGCGVIVHATSVHRTNIFPASTDRRALLKVSNDCEEKISGTATMSRVLPAPTPKPTVVVPVASWSSMSASVAATPALVAGLMAGGDMTSITALQFSATLGTMDACASPALRGTSTVTRYLLSPFFDLGKMWIVLGNSMLMFAISGLHVSVVWIMMKRSKISFAVGAVLAQYPGRTSSLVLTLSQGTVQAAASLLWGSDSSAVERVVGGIGSLVILCIVALMIKGYRLATRLVAAEHAPRLFFSAKSEEDMQKKLKLLHRIAHKRPPGPLSHFLLWILPCGMWKPKELERAFGHFLRHTKEVRLMLVAQTPMFAGWGSGILTSSGVVSPARCSMIWALLLVNFLCAAVLLLWKRPFLTGVETFSISATLIATALLCLCKAADFGDSSAAVFSGCITALSCLKGVHSLFLAWAQKALTLPHFSVPPLSLSFVNNSGLFREKNSLPQNGASPLDWLPYLDNKDTNGNNGLDGIGAVAVEQDLTQMAEMSEAGGTPDAQLRFLVFQACNAGRRRAERSTIP